jgi:hypothetical protein
MKLSRLFKTKKHKGLKRPKAITNQSRMDDDGCHIFATHDEAKKFQNLAGGDLHKAKNGEWIVCR